MPSCNFKNSVLTQLPAHLNASVNTVRSPPNFLNPQTIPPIAAAAAMPISAIGPNPINIDTPAIVALAAIIVNEPTNCNADIPT